MDSIDFSAFDEQQSDDDDAVVWVSIVLARSNCIFSRPSLWVFAQPDEIPFRTLPQCVRLINF